METLKGRNPTVMQGSKWSGWFRGNTMNHSKTCKTDSSISAQAYAYDPLEFNLPRSWFLQGLCLNLFASLPPSTCCPLQPYLYLWPAFCQRVCCSSMLTAHCCSTHCFPMDVLGFSLFYYFAVLRHFFWCILSRFCIIVLQGIFIPILHYRVSF